MRENIGHIPENALCTACGACAGICPKKAITMTHNPAGYLTAVLDKEKCVNCGKCYAVCPSNPQVTLQDEKIDLFHGQCLGAYIGHATDEEIRQKSQSGGIVTALLCYLLEKKAIDGAVVNKFDAATKRPQAVLATSKESIIEGCGSYYAQSAVAETILSHTDKRTAAVVLGCQAESLARIKQKYPDIQLPLYTIGLFCAGQNSGRLIDDLIEQSKYDLREDLVQFRFRDKRVGGWPGNVGIYSNKNVYKLDKSRRLALKPIYEEYRCILCSDQVNVFSDIVVGDPWGISRDDMKKGFSVVIARTEEGKALIEDAARDGAIAVEEIPAEMIMKGQTVDNRHKTKFFTARDICGEKNWMLPYNSACFEDVAYQKADKKTRAGLAKRLDYSRKFYLETDANRIEQMIKHKKTNILLKNLINSPLRFLKKCVSYALRRFKLRLGKK
ncbi:MAG: Coenzyme F420 hydrogenase/dehydrogenase, beta subunit C-terminal domain [Bacillota bacterium]